MLEPGAVRVGVVPADDVHGRTDVERDAEGGVAGETRPRVTTTTAPTAAIQAAATGSMNRAAVTTPTAAATTARMGVTGRPPTDQSVVDDPTGDTSANRRRSTTISARAATIVASETISPNVTGPWAVQVTVTSTGARVGSIHQPLKPPSTRVGSPRSVSP